MKKKNEIKIRVRYGETDQMGIVYHGNYPQYMEVGRIEWLRNLGVSYKSMEESGVMLPVVSLNLNYRKSAKYDEVLKVITTLEKTPTVKIEFTYEILNETDEIIATGSTVLAFVSMKSRKPMKCPDYILKKINIES